MTILDKYAENGQYFLQFRIDSGYYIDKYNIKDNIRTYKLADHALFDQIDQNRAEDYAGITIEAMIDRRNISQEEARGIESDPFSIISRQEYSQYITVVNLSELKNDITDTTPNVVLAKVQGFKYRQRILPFTKPMSLLLKKCPTK